MNGVSSVSNSHDGHRRELDRGFTSNGRGDRLLLGSLFRGILRVRVWNRSGSHWGRRSATSRNGGTEDVPGRRLRQRMLPNNQLGRERPRFS